MKTIQYDYSHMLAEKIGEEFGITSLYIQNLIPRLQTAQQAIKNQQQAGDLQWMYLPHNTDVAQACLKYAQQNTWVKHLVVVGIGGSALGAISLDHTFASCTPTDRTFRCFDNVDPEEISAYLQSIDLSKTLFNIVSKSGSTLETAAGFLYIRQLLQETFPDNYNQHLVLTTSEKVGILRHVAKAENIPLFVHPDDVGGRFSVLSVTGLLPAAFLDIDLLQLLSGAAHMDTIAQNEPFENNPAMQFATMQYLSYQEKQQNIVTMMPYSYRLKKWPEWFKQLWAESLGKQFNRKEQEIRIGQTPTQALGATDQHSQIQLFNCGPRERNIIFLEVENFSQDLVITSYPTDVPDFAYLKNTSFSEIMHAELAGTRYALKENKIATSTLKLHRVDEFHIGQLIYLLEYATALSGELYDIDAFDQPGVELGKDVAYALLGREGFTELQKKIDQE